MIVATSERQIQMLQIRDENLATDIINKLGKLLG